MDLITDNCPSGAFVSQEIGRRKLQRCPRAKIKDVIQDRDPVLRLVLPAFWKGTELW